MTDDQHRQIARILGFPQCCTEAWIISLRNGVPAAVERGGIHERLRTPREVEALHGAVSALLGRPWGALDCGMAYGDMEKCYVPCEQCALVREHWYPSGGGRWSIAELEAQLDPNVLPPRV